jgi:sulfur relay (sulfurtransferase) DsrC/TusE family protein
MTRESYLHHVFLSYSRKDSKTMRRVRDGLRAEGLTIWTDETGLEPGTPDWEEAIAEAIKGSQCMVVLLSPDAAKSKWVGTETAYAEERGFRIFPFLVWGDPLDAVPFRLTTYHRIDARSNYSGAIRMLIESVCKYLGVESLSAQRIAKI